jgi:CDP-diacylglycerol--glycerol-3-phosphate 3-phosphatidyltransferase
MYITQRSPSIWSNHHVLLIAILALEVSMYIISLLRFKKLPSPHAILSKFWGIYLVIEFTLLILGVTGSHFQIALYFGLVAHIDRILIYSFIRTWDHDIPSSYQAFLLRQGKPIQRWKLFNG